LKRIGLLIIGFAVAATVIGTASLPSGASSIVIPAPADELGDSGLSMAWCMGDSALWLSTQGKSCAKETDDHDTTDLSGLGIYFFSLMPFLHRLFGVNEETIKPKDIRSSALEQPG